MDIYDFQINAIHLQCILLQLYFCCFLFSQVFRIASFLNLMVALSAVDSIVEAASRSSVHVAAAAAAKSSDNSPK